ncbi:MAG: nicotinate-nucleotide adenylyltransferase [Bacillota bacterium]
MPHVGILGGTFDPIHLGHLALAEGAMHLARLDRVIFLPNRQPPHKQGRPVSAAAHRAEMVKLAIAGNPRFEYSDLELRREGPSYTIDTVQAFQALHPDWRLAFLAGMDSLLEITTWRDYQTLLTQVDLLVVNRPGFPTEQGEQMLHQLGPQLSRRIRILEIPGLAVAGRDLRRLAGQGYPLRYLVPEAVEQYIAEQRLYHGPRSMR